MDLNNLVTDALRKLPEYSECLIWTVDNHEKYSTINREQANQEQIFKLMHALNAQGIYQSNTCADIEGKGSLNETVHCLGEKLSILTRNKRIHYIELGPEPIKTGELIKHLKDSTEDLIYTAIDINETSESFMRQELEPLLKSRNHFRFIASDYHNVDRTQLECGQDITLITMLGFQEGNELPSRIGKLICQLSAKSTYIISEVQMYKPDNQDHIHQFYRNDNMVKFSKLVSIQQGFQPFGIHKVQIVPVHLDGDIMRMAVTCQPVRKERLSGFLITNICIKFTLQQFADIRMMYGNSKVIEEFVSGDKSVAFHLAKYNID